MEFYLNKHYVRIDTNNFIVKGYSDAFEVPLETDICINEKGGRHFELLGEVNPPLNAIDGTHLYKYEEETIRGTTQDERDAELESFPAPAPQITIEERVTIAEDIINYLLGL